MPQCLDLCLQGLRTDSQGVGFAGSIDICQDDLVCQT